MGSIGIQPKLSAYRQEVADHELRYRARWRWPIGEATALLSIVILVLFLLITPLGKRLTSSRAAGVFAGGFVKALQAGEDRSNQALS